MGPCVGAAAPAAMQPCLRLPSLPTRRPFQSFRRTQIAPLAVSARQGGPRSVQQPASAGTPVDALPRAAGTARHQARQPPRARSAPPRSSNTSQDVSRARRLALPVAAAQLLAAAQASAMGGMAPAGGAAPGAGDAATGLMTAGTQEPMITGMFGAAVLALIVVTGGAAYLAITGILDERTEKKDRVSDSSQSAKKLVQRDRSKAQKKAKITPRKGGGKGFS